MSASTIDTNSSVLDTILADEAFTPSEPTSISEVGLPVSLIESLILKRLSIVGISSGRALSRDICISFNLVDPLLQNLRSRQILVHKGSALPKSGSRCYESLYVNLDKEILMTKKKGKRHTPEQIVKKLRDAETMLNSGKDLAAVFQSLEISEQTYYRWRNQYGGMKSTEAKRLKELEAENQQLKEIVAEQQLDIKMLKHITEGN